MTNTNIHILNATPHAITITGGPTYQPSGFVARVSMTTQIIDHLNGIPVFKNIPGDVDGIPAPQPGVFYIVSAMVLANSDRDDLIAPNTNSAVRNDQGHIVSVPGFVSR